MMKDVTIASTVVASSWFDTPKSGQMTPMLPCTTRYIQETVMTKEQITMPGFQLRSPKGS